MSLVGFIISSLIYLGLCLIPAHWLVGKFLDIDIDMPPLFIVVMIIFFWPFLIVFFYLNPSISKVFKKD